MLLSILNNLDLSAKKNLEFDALAFETKHQEDYEQSQSIREFSENYRDNPRDTFIDGQWDGYLNMMPEPYQWQTPSYRSGYLSGVAQRFDEQFSQR